MIDAIGCYNLGRRWVHYLRSAGAKVTYFNPFRLFGGGRFFTRNHRKTLTVDGAVGFVGGLNLAVDHLPRPQGGGWHDAAVRLTGPVIAQLDAVFFREWNRMHKRHMRVKHVAKPPPPAEPPIGVCEVLSNRAFAQRFTIRRRYLQSIRGAKRTITIANAYFLPSASVLNTLRAAVRRGVHVRLLLPAIVDVPLLKLAQFGYYDRFLRWGFEIYEWPETMLHHKVATFDDEVLAIGSYNLDRRSLRHNLEISVWLSASPAVGDAVQALARDIQRSQHRTRAEWIQRGMWQRVVEAFAFLLREQF
jgi:cardiolipin synthase